MQLKAHTSSPMTIMPGPGQYVDQKLAYREVGMVFKLKFEACRRMSEYRRTKPFGRPCQLCCTSIVWHAS